MIDNRLYIESKSYCRVCVMKIILAFCLLLLVKPAIVLADLDTRVTRDEIVTTINKLYGDSFSKEAMQLQGKVTLLGGFPGTYKLRKSGPDRYRVDWDIGYISQQRGFNSGSAWENNAGARELVGSDLERIRAEAQLLPLPSMLLSSDSFSIAEGESNELILTFSEPGQTKTTLKLDKDTKLPKSAWQLLHYKEGLVKYEVEYSNYKYVNGVPLPFKLKIQAIDLPMQIVVDSYNLDKEAQAEIFSYPYSDKLDTPYELSLSTFPDNIYKERLAEYGSSDWTRYWGVPNHTSDHWIAELVVTERYGRHVEARELIISMYSGTELIEQKRLFGNAISNAIKNPVTRFSPRPQIFNIRTNFIQPSYQNIDRVRFTLEIETPSGVRHKESLDVPIKTYQTKKELVFPVKGNFIVQAGHEFHELAHTYEQSQHFSYDISCLGPQFELLNNTTLQDAPISELNQSHWGFGRCEIVSPADGIVVYARNDVPDDMPSAQLLSMKDGLWAIAGNIVMIDHGDKEYSLFAHMHQGSVTVTIGQQVKQGQTIGRLGASGSPGFPHLHYQLQSSPGLFDSGGLPTKFSNIIIPVDNIPVYMPRRGIYLTTTE